MSLLISGSVTLYGESLTNGTGGLIGVFIVRMLRQYFNVAGTYIILFLIFVIALTFMVEFSMVSVTGKISQFTGALFSLVKSRVSSFVSFVMNSTKIERKTEPEEEVIEELPPVVKKALPKKVEQTNFNFTKPDANEKFQIPPFTLMENAPQKAPA